MICNLFFILINHTIRMSIICIHRNVGFFSGCSVRLQYIVAYINEMKQIPNSVDSSMQFD
jgi:hypothetical protein